MDDAAALVMLNATESEIKAFSDDEWRTLIWYLVGRLQEYFGCRIVTEPIEDASVGEGFCFDIASEREAPDSPMNWKGILGATIIDGKLYVSLTVFLYSGGKRLFARDGNEFVEYDLDLSRSDKCRWKLFGWFKDDYEEYDSFL